MKLSDIRRVLADRQLQLTRSLGQNFLHDGNQLRRIIAAAGLQSTDRVLEIGPGLGPLTELLLAQAGHVLALEKDQRLVEFLQLHFAGNPQLELLHVDALDYLRTQARNWSQWKLVANLPFSVASPILVELALLDHGPGRLVVTLQREVAHRLTAGPSAKDYGLLTLLIAWAYTTTECFRIPPDCFFPAPDVESAGVVLVRRPQPWPDASVRDTYVRLARRGFSARRKMLRKLLRQEWPEALIADAFAALGIAPEARAEALSPDTFLALAHHFARDNPAPIQPPLHPTPPNERRDL